MAELIVQKAVVEEVRQAGRDDFTAFFFNHFDNLIVCHGVEFDVNFADNTDTRFFQIFPDGKRIEIRYDLMNVFLKCCYVGFFQIYGKFGLPLCKEGFRGTTDFFIRTRAIKHLLQCIAVDDALK